MILYSFISASPRKCLQYLLPLLYLPLHDLADSVRFRYSLCKANLQTLGNEVPFYIKICRRSYQPLHCYTRLSPLQINEATSSKLRPDWGIPRRSPIQVLTRWWFGDSGWRVFRKKNTRKKCCFFITYHSHVHGMRTHRLSVVPLNLGCGSRSVPLSCTPWWNGLCRCISRTFCLEQGSWHHVHNVPHSHINNIKLYPSSRAWIVFLSVAV